MTDTLNIYHSDHWSGILPLGPEPKLCLFRPFHPTPFKYGYTSSATREISWFWGHIKVCQVSYRFYTVGFVSKFQSSSYFLTTVHWVAVPPGVRFFLSYLIDWCRRFQFKGSFTRQNKHHPNPIFYSPVGSIGWWLIMTRKCTFLLTALKTKALYPI